MGKKLFTAVEMLLACAVVVGCSAPLVEAEPKVRSAITRTRSFAEKPVEKIELAVEEPPVYDRDTNYMSLMVRHAARGDMDSLAAAVAARNEKIVSEGLPHDELTVETFLRNFESIAGFSLEKDYLREMVSFCVSGNVAAGRVAAAGRNRKLDAMESAEARIDFDELYLLSKIITHEAGCSWLPMDWKMIVGEVLLNRVASVEFPDTMEECVYQPGQYAGVRGRRFQRMTPFQDCVEAAARLLGGERVLNEPSAVFQSGCVQGGGVCRRLYDPTMGTTYICYSSYPELYREG